MLNTHYPQDASYQFPSLDEGLRLLDQALTLSSDDPTLHAHILNNRVFFFASQDPLENVNQFRSDYERLLALQQELEPAWENWPPFVLDTIAWASWRLGEDNSAQGRSQIIRYLQHALRSNELEDNERKHIQDRLETVRKARQTTNTS